MQAKDVPNGTVFVAVSDFFILYENILYDNDILSEFAISFTEIP